MFLIVFFNSLVPLVGTSARPCRFVAAGGLSGQQVALFPRWVLEQRRKSG